MVYLIIFLLSTAFCWMAQRCETRNQKKSVRFFNTVAILIPAVLAGIRNESVGTDIKVYLNNVYNLAENSGSIIAYFSSMFVLYPSIGVGFSFLVYAVSFVFDDVHWVYFFINLLPMALIYYGVKRNNGNKNRPLIWLLILLLLYNNSLNLMRQIIAIAIVYWAHKYIIRRNMGKYLFSCFIALLFHDTAIIFVLLYFAYSFVGGKNSSLRMVLSCTMLVVFLFIYQGILEILVQIGILSSRFITMKVFEGGIHFGGIVAQAPMLMAIYVLIIDIATADKGQKRRSLNYYSVIAVLNAVFFSIGSATSDAYRIGYYTMIFMPEILLRATGKFEKNSRRIMTLLLVALIIFYWYFLFILNRFAATVPYITDLL